MSSLKGIFKESFLPCQQSPQVHFSRMLLICFALLIVWSAVFLKPGWLELFAEHIVIAVMMVVGSFVAGSTPLGGGAVAFPVMTKLLSTPPESSMHFSLMIQSIGMTSASILILLSRHQLPWRGIALYLIGSFFGFYIVTQYLYVTLSSAEVKVMFSLNISIFLLVYLFGYYADKFNERQIQVCRRKVITLVAFGCLGGGMSAFIGSGADLFAFALFTIYFRLNIVLATLASVIIMATTSIFGLFTFFFQGVQPAEVILEYWYVAAPVVIFGAPIGAWVCCKVSKKVIHYMIIALSSLELASTLLLLPLGERSALIFCLQLLVMFALFSWNRKQMRKPG